MGSSWFINVFLRKTIPSLILGFAGAATGNLAISAGTALLAGAIDMSQGYDENSGQIVGDYKALLEKILTIMAFLANL